MSQFASDCGYWEEVVAVNSSSLISPLAACDSVNSGEFLARQTSVSRKLALVKHVKYKVPVAGITVNILVVESETCLDYYYEDWLIT